MSKIRTGKELQQWLEEQRLKFQRKKEIEKQRQKKEKAEKREARRKREERLLRQEKPVLQNNNIYIGQRSIRIYHTKYIRRDSDDGELFTTREELQEWERENRPCINWELWDKLVNEMRNESKSRKRRTSI